MTSAPSVSDLLNLRGKVALVTGASAGIGRGLATRLSDAGAAIAVHYRGGKEDADALASTLRSKGRNSLSVYAELSDSQSVERAIEMITDVEQPAPSADSTRAMNNDARPPAKPVHSVPITQIAIRTISSRTL